MTGYNKVFIDTAPLIYFLDADVNFGYKAEDIFSQIISAGKEMITSVITCEEYLVYPYRTGNEEKIKVFFDFLHDCNIPAADITSDMAIKAAEIRAKYKDFKAMDSLQLATACQYGCDVFLTNDRQLLQFPDIKCVMLADWI